MLSRNQFIAALAIICLLLSCGHPGPVGTGGAGAGNIPTTKVEQGDGLLLRKAKKYRPHADTTLIVLDSSNRMRVNDVIFQGPDFNRLIVNQWESAYHTDGSLPSAFSIDFQREVYMGQRGSIYDAIARAQDTVRLFIMKQEGIDSAAANRKYPVLVQKVSW